MLEASVAEFIYTFMLCFVVLNAACSSAQAGKNQFYGLARKRLSLMTRGFTKWANWTFGARAPLYICQICITCRSLVFDDKTRQVVSNKNVRSTLIKVRG